MEAGGVNREAHSVVEMEGGGAEREVREGLSLSG